MVTYAFLVLPAHNRVYGKAAIGLTAAELSVFNQQVLHGRLSDIGERTIGAVPYVTFSCDEVTERDVGYLSNLSSIYALFEVDTGSLRPVTLRRLDRFGDDLVTIQRYSGKTNEHFTKLLLNVTLVCSARAGDFLDRPVRVIDPLCGRGTSLNQALVYGFDAAGVDGDSRAVAAYGLFIKTWLQDQRLKHSSASSTLRRGGKTVGRRVDITLAASKADLKGGQTRQITVIHDDTRYVGDHFRKESFDVLVADLPYGVQHGTRDRDRALARSPGGLLDEALPGWIGVLAPGAALGLSWNARVMGRPELVSRLQAAGLHVLDGPNFRAFEHRVDQSIQRDLVVARKA
jgi:hypothetical protein